MRKILSFFVLLITGLVLGPFVSSSRGPLFFLTINRLEKQRPHWGWGKLVLAWRRRLGCGAAVDCCKLPAPRRSLLVTGGFLVILQMREPLQMAWFHSENS